MGRLLLGSMALGRKSLISTRAGQTDVGYGVWQFAERPWENQAPSLSLASPVNWAARGWLKG